MTTRHQRDDSSGGGALLGASGELLEEGLCLLDPELRFLAVNAAAAAQLRLASAALLGRTWLEVFPAAAERPLHEALRRCLAARVAEELEVALPPSGETQRWFRLRVHPVPAGLVLLSLDIDDRRRARRALEVLSACREAVVSAPDETALWAATCRLAVERGGYRLAWIGAKLDDPAQTVLPLASAGLDDGYVASIAATWGDGERGRGPVGRALATGEPRIVRHLDDPDLEPWREAARARGYGSVIAIPVKVEGLTIAALAVYAREADAFDEAERSLLEEVAGQVGFGIASLRTDAVRRRVEARLEGLVGLLKGARRVNQLISHERDPQQLLQRSCELLVTTGGLDACCCAVTDDAGPVRIGAAGAGVEPEALRALVASGSLPDCLREDGGPGRVGVCRGERATCRSCPRPWPSLAASEVVIVPFATEVAGEGWLMAVLPDGRSDDVETVELLEGVASDIASAWRGLALEADRARTASALASAEVKYRELLENIHDVVFSLDLTGRFTYVSPTIEAVFGYRPEEVLGHEFVEVVVAADLPAVTAEFAAVLAGGGVPLEFRGRDRAGRIRSVRVTSRVRRDDGVAVGVDGVLVDLTELRSAEAGRRESDLRYRGLFEHAPFGIAHFSLLDAGDRVSEARLLEANAAFAELTAFSVTTAGRVAEERITGLTDSDPNLLLALERVARNHSTERYEIQTRRSGQWLSVVVFSPRPEEAAVVVEGITQRKHAEQQRLESSRRMERLSDTLQRLARVRDLDAIIEVVRHGLRELTGADGVTYAARDGDACCYLDEDAVAPLWKDRRFPLAESLAGRVIQAHRPLLIEDTTAAPPVAREDLGGTFVRSLLVVPVGVDAPVGAIGCYWAQPRSISAEEQRVVQAVANATAVALETSRLLRALAETEMRMRSVYDHLPSLALVWRWDGDTASLEDFNAAVWTTTRGEIARFVGRSAAELGESLPELEEDLRVCHAEKRPVARTVSWQMPGAIEPQRLQLTYAFVPADLLVLHAVDVTEQERTEAQLRHAQRLEAVGRLAGGVAHDFNNLLSVITTYAGFAMEGRSEGDPVLEDLREIHRASQRAAILTRQLLAFSRQQVLAPEVLNLNTVVEDLAGILRRTLGEDIEIVLELGAGLGNVELDPSQLEQVLMNLATNARDAMPSGGTLTLRTENRELAPAAIAAVPAVAAGPYVCVTVRDSGSGMDAATLERAFEPFYTTKERGKGTGLGLATVHGIVTQSGGHVRLESEVGRGTQFELLFPRVDAEASPRRSVPPAGITMGRGGVLLVEDDAAVRVAAARALERAGYHVQAAANAGEATLLYERHRDEIDLLLTDIVMPHVTGWDLAEMLRRRSPTLKVLFMSGFAEHAVVQLRLAGGGVHFLPKPFTAESLTRRVSQVLASESDVEGAAREGPRTAR